MDDAQSNFIQVSVADSGRFTTYVNRVSASSTTYAEPISATNIYPLTIGAGSNAALGDSSRWNGRVYGVVHIDELGVSAANRQLVETYLASLSGVTI